MVLLALSKVNLLSCGDDYQLLFGVVVVAVVLVASSRSRLDRGSSTSSSDRNKWIAKFLRLLRLKKRR